MNFLLISLNILCFFCSFTFQSDTVDEYNLKKVLFNTTYDRTIRPADSINLYVKMTMKQIIGLNEKTQIITTSSYLFVYWTDPRLAWDQTKYNQLVYLNVPASQIWLPDLYVINTADSNGFLSMSSNYIVGLNCDGKIYMNIGLIGLNTRCAMNIYKFPNDVQTCSIIIGSWFQDDSRLILNLDSQFSSQSNLIEYSKNSIWSLTNTSVSLVKNGARFLNIATQSDFSFDLTIKRQSLYYMYSSVYPCLILNFVTLFTFFFPFSIQASLTITTFLNLAIISVRVSGDIPVQSDYLPLISLFFFLGILYTFLSFIWFVIAENLKAKKYVPAFIQIMVNRINLLKKTRTVRVVANKETNEAAVNIEIQKNEVPLDLIISYLNVFAWLIMLLLMLISYVSIWIIISV